MVKMFVFAVSLLLSVSSSKGLKCWSCENAETVEHCDKIGELQQCNPSQDMCGIEVRHNGGWQLSEKVKVFKFCKQRRACGNVQNQNEKRASVINQCNPKFPSSVCRCCCGENGCNVGDLKCLDVQEPSVCFPNHSAPTNGLVYCTNGSHANSVCTFSCNTGYYLEGDYVSVCQSTEGLRWTTPPPVCQEVTCPKIPELDNGSFRCSNDVTYGSLCRFTCDLGYRLIGPESTICEDDIIGSKYGKWSTNGQICQQERCKGELAVPEHGSMYCTNLSYIGSVCYFSCEQDYDMAGAGSATCQEADMNGQPYWDDIEPICKIMECDSLPTHPENVYMVCTEEKFIHSVCKFSCDAEYYLFGEPETVCTAETDDALEYSVPRWSNDQQPTCERKYCSESPAAPEYGETYCSDEAFLGSICTFQCNESHYLVGYESTACVESKDDLPHWNNETPACKPKRCMIPLEAPRHGTVTCDNFDFLGSVCEFSCGKAYYRKGAAVTTCMEDFMDGKLYWDFPTPVCIINQCDSMPLAPRDGGIECSDMNFVGSVCRYSCDAGYDLIGSEQTACIQYFESDQISWDGNYAECVRQECSYFPSVPDHGDMYCTDEKFYGSVCQFMCDSEYELLETNSTKCGYLTNRTPEWDYKTPVCTRNKCPSVAAPDNGRAVCSDKQFIGSICEYVCDDYHRRIGTLYTTCTEDDFGYRRWTGEIPVCERITCPQLKTIKNGMIQCTDGEYVKSECSFSCTDDDHKLSPKARHSVTCQNDTMWSEKQPCCARPCPPFAAMDLVVILDSSSSIGAASWPIMLNFVNNIFELFAVQVDTMHFGVIRYNREIDTEHQINLNEYPHDVDMLKNLVSNIPYNGQGTWTGQAMTYVNENMLTTEAGNRELAPDVVLVITDGRSQDDVTGPAEALRARGALTFALGITPLNGKLDLDQLRTIAGSEKTLFLAKGGFNTLTPQFAEKISESICGDPCDRII